LSAGAAASFSGAAVRLLGQTAAMSRFLERLGAGPPIVADGGMGALIASAVERLRVPEEANTKAP
jgi:hypothetical protein